ncbi:MAG: ribonuclease, Rne/Rng family [Frankiales bacterium]|nr:ribonuclease, Rne/Rng family [Frankiales bacterium]
MLDATNDNTPESTESGTPNAGGPDAAAPAKKAARRPAQKRTAKKTAAPAATESGSNEASNSAVPAGADAGNTESAAPVAARARKAPAKRAAKKVAAPVADADSADGAAATADRTPGAETPEPALNGEPTQALPVDAAPAKKTARKRTTRATKAAASDADQATAAPADDGSTEAAVSDSPSTATPALSAPVVLFQPPSEVAAPTRRRRAAKAAPPVEQIALDVDDDPDAEASEAADAVDESDDADSGQRPRRRRGRRGRGSRTADPAGEIVAETDADIDEDVDEVASESELEDHAEEVAEAALSASARRRRRRRRSSTSGEDATEDDPPNTVVHVRETRSSSRGSGGGGGGGGGAADDDGVRGVKGSTRLEAKRQRRRDNRDTGRRRAPILTEAEFLARRESVERVMAVRQTDDRTQIAVLEDGILVEHYVTRASASSAVGNVYLGRVQNVLPSMEAAFVDIGRGRNGVLYAGEVNWDAAGLEGKARSIENALNPGDAVLVQVTKDPIGHKGARLTSQVSLAGRFLVFVPGGGMTGISRRLPDVERSRLKAILKQVVPEDAGVIVRTAAEGASEEDLVSDVERLKAQWALIQTKTGEADSRSGSAPSLVYGEPDLAIRVVRDVFNDDFSSLTVAGADTHATITSYVADVAPDLADRISLYTGTGELFHDLRVDEQLAKALDRKVWLPSGGSLVIDRTEAMTVVDVNTGKYTGSGGNLEQTVTRNNLEAAEEIVRQLRLRDIGGIIVIDFIDMVLESNRDLVLRRLTECLGRDRTKHQVAEVTSLGLVQMTRKRVGEGLLEAFSEPCPHCGGRGLIIHAEPIEKKGSTPSPTSGAPVEDDRSAKSGRRNRRGKSTSGANGSSPSASGETEPTDQLSEAEQAAEAERRRAAANAIAAIAAASGHRDDLPPEVVEAAADDLAATVADISLDVGLALDEDDSDTEPAEEEALVEADAAPPSRNSRPRRRRAASRPAGPPVTSSVPVGSSGG